MDIGYELALRLAEKLSLAPEERDKLKRNFEYWDKMLRPLEDELRRSTILNAEDYSPLVYAS